MNPSKLLHLSAAALCTLALASASAQTATTPPAGFVTLACAANSDTRISTPLTRPPEFTGAIASVAGSIVTVSGTPGWLANQFGYTPPAQPRYYASFGPTTPASAYSAEGKFFTVNSNDPTTLTLDLAGDSLGTVPAGAQIQLIPYWTLATVWPASDAGVSFIVSASALSRQTEILIPNHAAAGTNAAPAITYFFFNGAWRKVGDALTVDHGTDILPAADNLLVRNKAAGTSLVVLGGVELKKVTTPLVTQISGKQDNFVAIVRPVDVAVQDLGLFASGAFVASPSALNRTDELLIFDNAAIGTNKASSATYFYFNGAWRKVGDALTVDHGPDLIPAGAGFVVRKAATAGGTASFWVNDKTYNP